MYKKTIIKGQFYPVSNLGLRKGKEVLFLHQMSSCYQNSELKLELSAYVGRCLQVRRGPATI